VDEGHGSHDETHAAEGDHVEQDHQDAQPAHTTNRTQKRGRAPARFERLRSAKFRAALQSTQNYPPVAEASARARTLAAAVIAEATADAAADGVGVGEEDARAEDAARWSRRRTQFPPSKYASPQGGEPRGTIIVARTTRVRKPASRSRAAPVLLLRATPTRSRSFFRRIARKISRQACSGTDG